MAGVMYVYYFAHLSDDPERWVQRLDSRREMLRRMATQSLSGEYPDAERADSLSVSDEVAVGQGYAIPFRWDAPQLFNDGLNGELTLQPIRPGLTQLAMRGSYTPPGQEDPWHAHRRVEAVVKKLMDSVAASS